MRRGENVDGQKLFSAFFIHTLKKCLKTSTKCKQHTYADIQIAHTAFENPRSPNGKIK